MGDSRDKNWPDGGGDRRCSTVCRHFTSPFLRYGLLAVLVGVVFLYVVRRRSLGWSRRVGAWLGAVLVAIGLLSAVYSAWVASGADDARRIELLSGVTYERLVVEEAVVHLVTVDLANPCVTVATSAVSPDGQAEASKTVTWAQKQAMAVAVNASFFFPYDQSRFWDVYPSEGETVTVLGPTVGLDENAQPVAGVSSTAWDGQTLWLDRNNRPSIELEAGVEPPQEVVLAVTGRERILRDGLVTAAESVPYPRTLVGIDRVAMTMWWMVVDGNQPGYSRGLTLSDAALFLQSLGAVDGLELDGGGSSTMVLDEGLGAQTVSRPMQIRIPGRSRAVANQLGIRAPSPFGPGPDCSLRDNGSQD